MVIGHGAVGIAIEFDQGIDKLPHPLTIGMKDVEVRTETNYFEHRQALDELAKAKVFTGKIDEYFDYRLGYLQYRTVKFEEERLPKSNYQGCAVVNYTDRTVPYTRIIEHKHFETFGEAVDKNPCTIISKEYSTEWKPGMEPYYPVNDERNNSLYQQYKQLADAEPNTLFGGRLAEYQYYDMAPIVEKVMDMFDAE